MKTAFLVLALVGLSTAAMPQQRSPVYQPQVTSTGATTSNVNSAPLLKSSLPAGPTSTMSPPSGPVPMAEARESVAADASMLNPQAVNPNTPSQNYYVYYYPNQQGTTIGQPNSSSILTGWPWYDVGIGAACLAAVVVGGGMLYTKYGQEVKTRALRELQDLSADDAARMARGVLRALEKFSTINNDTE